MTTVAQHNRNLAPKKVNKFYVKFFGMEDNVSNVLGRQVTSLERPTITFNVSENRHKMVKRNDVSEIEFDPITIEFNDDLNSLTIKALYNQVTKQSLNTGDYLFEIKVEVYADDNNIVEHFVIKHCFIQSLSHSQHIYSNSENNTITATIGFGTVEYIFD
jgi:hypothetical protein